MLKAKIFFYEYHLVVWLIVIWPLFSWIVLFGSLLKGLYDNIFGTMDNNIDYTVADNNDCFVAKVDFIMNDNNYIVNNVDFIWMIVDNVYIVNN